MAQIISKISLNVDKPNLIQAIVAKQYDSKSRFLQVTLIHEGEKIEIAPTSTVTINAKRKDGSEKSFAGETNNDGTATVPLTYWMLEIEGEMWCDVSVVDTDGRKLSSTKFILEVEKASYSDSEISQDDNYGILVKLIEDVNKAKPDIKYDPTSTNAQSGLAVAEAVATANSYTDGKIMRLINYISIPSNETADMILIDKNGANESFSLKHIKFMIDLRIPSSLTVRVTVRANGVALFTIPQFTSLLTVKIIGEIKIFQAGTNINYSYLTSNPNIPVHAGILDSTNLFATLPPVIKNPIKKIDVSVVDETNNIIQLKAGSSIELWGC